MPGKAKINWQENSVRRAGSSSCCNSQECAASDLSQGIQDLNKQGSVRSSEVRSLDPFIDPQGILRVGGRIWHSSLSELQKHPTILPSKHHVSRPITEQEHMRNLHAGCQSLLHIIRERFWLIKGKRTIQSVLKNWKTCFRVAPKEATAEMVDLPSSRILPARPFQRVGLDYAGPVTIKQGTRRNAPRVKAYVLVFVCFVVKAIHLELVANLTTEASIDALRRFVARRGRCTKAKTFIAANKQ